MRDLNTLQRKVVASVFRSAHTPRRHRMAAWCDLSPAPPTSGAGFSHDQKPALLLLREKTPACGQQHRSVRGAAVIAQAITGNGGSDPTVGSRLLTQVFSVRDGRCLDDESRAPTIYDVRMRDGIDAIASQ